MRYIPPDVSKSSWAASVRLAAVQNSALAQATKQWTANSKQVAHSSEMLAFNFLALLLGA